MTERSRLRSQRLRQVNHQGDALRLGMNWTEEDLANEELAERRRILRQPRPRYESGILGLYSRVARVASQGASIT
jgi:hypothetical protein